MSAPIQWLYDPTSPVEAPFGSTQVLAVGDIVGADGNGLVYRAEDTSWDSTESATRDDFVATFLGICSQKKRTGDAQPYGNSAATVRVDTSGVFEADLNTATTLQVGDYVGPAKASGNALVSQTVKKVTVGNEAIGVVVEAGTSLTRCKFRILSRKVPAAPTNAIESGA